MKFVGGLVVGIVTGAAALSAVAISTTKDGWKTVANTVRSGVVNFGKPKAPANPNPDANGKGGKQ